MLTTTFKKLREHKACEYRYRYLRKSWTKEDRPKDTEAIPLLRILESNGLEDALWALRACGPEDMRDRTSRLFAADCAERVLPIFENRRPTDSRIRDCIDTTRRYARGKATLEELRRVSSAAYAAFMDEFSVTTYRAAYAAYAAAGASSSIHASFVALSANAAAVAGVAGANAMDAEDAVEFAARAAIRQADAAIALARRQVAAAEAQAAAVAVAEARRERVWQEKRLRWYLAKERK